MGIMIPGLTSAGTQQVQIGALMMMEAGRGVAPDIIGEKRGLDKGITGYAADKKNATL